MQHNKKRGVVLLITIGWVVFAQSCFRFRISDEKARAQFAAAKVPLQINSITTTYGNLHYAQTGQSQLPTLLFIHGSPGSWDGFAQYMQDSALLQHFRMISVDRPGFGHSNFGVARHLHEQTAAIGALLPLIQNNQPVYLIGHSLGGPLVIDLAATFPQYCNGIVILAGSIDPNMEDPEKWRWVFAYTPLGLLMPGAFVPSNKEIWYLKKDLLQMPTQMSKVACPVYLVHGNKDQFVPYNNMIRNVRSFTSAPSTDTLTIAGANHFIPWEHFATIKQLLLRLNKLPSTALLK